MLNSFFPEFYTYCKALNLAPNSIKNLKRYLSRLNDFLNARNLTSIEQITYAHLSDFAAFNDAAPSTVKARIWALKKFCAFLHLHDYIAVNNANGLSAPKMPKKETGFLNEDELKIIFSYLLVRRMLFVWSASVNNLGMFKVIHHSYRHFLQHSHMCHDTLL